MQIIISDDAKSAITDIYDYSYNILLIMQVE